MARITVVGAGGFGLALAVMCERHGHEVRAWSAREAEVQAIRRDGEHKRLLPGVPVPPTIELTSDIASVSGADIVIFAVPSTAVREVAALVVPAMTAGTVLVNVGKGLEAGSLKRLSEVLAEENPRNPVVVLSGPSHAEEVARGIPTTVVASSMERRDAEYVQDALLNKDFRIYVNDDVVGCELGGALKNPIALCAGILDGMELGDNPRAALMTRGIAEIARLGVALGGRVETFAGLTGIGDLIVTCTSMHSRNHRAGILIGKGIPPKEAVARVGTVEGYTAAKVAWELAGKAGVDMPITEQLYRVLYEGKASDEAIRDLMGRPRKHETEATWFEER